VADSPGQARRYATAAPGRTDHQGGCGQRTGPVDNRGRRWDCRPGGGHCAVARRVAWWSCGGGPQGRVGRVRRRIASGTTCFGGRTRTWVVPDVDRWCCAV